MQHPALSVLRYFASCILLPPPASALNLSLLTAVVHLAAFLSLTRLLAAGDFPQTHLHANAFRGTEFQTENTARAVAAMEVAARMAAS